LLFLTFIVNANGISDTASEIRDRWCVSYCGRGGQIAYSVCFALAACLAVLPASRPQKAILWKTVEWAAPTFGLSSCEMVPYCVWSYMSGKQTLENGRKIKNPRPLWEKLSENTIGWEASNFLSLAL